MLKPPDFYKHGNKSVYVRPLNDPRGRIDIVYKSGDFSEDLIPPDNNWWADSKHRYVKISPAEALEAGFQISVDEIMAWKKFFYVLSQLC